MADPRLKRARASQGQSLYDYIVRSEGKGKEGRPGYAYKDHKGNLTIGVGHLITPNDPILKRVVGGNYNSITSGLTPLSEKQMKQLFDYDVQSKIKLARRKLSNFDKLPRSMQNAVVDGFFRGDLSGSPKTLKLMNSGDFKAAAIEYLDNDEYRKSKKDKTGVAPRMERNAAIWKSSSPVRRTVQPIQESKAPFDPEGDGYNYRRARELGIKPDETGHWPSREPATGEILKGRRHKTFDKTLKGEEDAGYRIFKGKDGKYYSVKKSTPSSKRVREGVVKGDDGKSYFRIRKSR